jgi:hypothetical protein
MLESTDDNALVYPLHNHLTHWSVNNAVKLMLLYQDSSTLLYFPSPLSGKVRASEAIGKGIARQVRSTF